MTHAAKTIPTFPDLAGKVAVVTGSSRGIGAETARYLAANRAKVAVKGRDSAALQRVVSEIESDGGEAIAVIADCTGEEQIENMRRQMEGRFGDIDLLMPFAGGGGPIQPIEDVSEEQWNSLLSANLTSKFLTIKSFLPGMKRRGAGSIVLMSSSAGRAVSHAALAYSTAQAGVITLARNLAQQLGRYGIRVNAIAPSAIRNERIEQSMSSAEQESLARTFPIQRIGEPRDVAAAALFLCSEASSWITGITLDIAGGKVWSESRRTEETVKTLLGFLMIANATLFFFGAIQHIGVTIGRFHEPRIIPAAMVETICGISLTWGAVIVLSRAVLPWSAPLVSNFIALCGVLLGMAALAAGRGPRTASNDLYHHIMLSLIAASFVVLVLAKSLAWRA